MKWLKQYPFLIAGAFFLCVTLAIAAGVKISDRPVAGALDGTEIVGLIQGGVDVQATVGTILGGAIAGWPTVSTTKEITWANSLANAVRIGDGATPGCFFTDATLGFLGIPCTPSNTRTMVLANFTWSLWDEEGSAAIETIDPDAASIQGIYTYGTNYRPKKVIYIDAGGMNVDGTNCTAPTEQALNSSEKTWAFSCADSNSSIFSSKVRMPASWDGGTVTFTLSLFHATAESITFAGDFSAECRAAGTAINSTYGTVQAADVSITTANNVAEATTAALTPNGTCTTAGTFLMWKYVVDAANFSTNAANSKVLSVSITYSEKSRSS